MKNFSVSVSTNPIVVSESFIELMDEYTYNIERYVLQLGESIDLLKQIQNELAISIAEYSASGEASGEEPECSLLKEYSDVSTRLGVITEIHDDLDALNQAIMKIDWREPGRY